MKKKISIIALLLFSLSLNLFSQKLDFTEYPAKVYTSSKAKLNLTSHKLGKTYRTAIKESYADEKINFGGHYIVVLWGCGTGCRDGVLADTKTGKLYSLPLTENNSYSGEVKYEPTSNLFVCSALSGTSMKNEIFSYFLLDEKTKKFKLIKSETRKTKKE